MRFTQRAAILVLSTVTLLLTITLFNPLPFNFPMATLDSGWSLAMNEAVAQGKVIGRDISFTFGPYAAVFTHQYHPATETSMLLVSLLLGISYGSGLLYVGFKKNIWISFLAPWLFLLLGGLREIYFLTLPLLHFLVVEQLTAVPRPLRARQNAIGLCVLVALTVSLAILPLVKGSFAIVGLFLGGCSFILMYRARAAFAFAGLAIFIATLAAGWAAASQPIAALPQYFIALLPIIAGYTDAMSLWQHEGEDIYFAVAATILMIPCLVRLRRDRTVPAVLGGIGLSATLFLAMKEGLVRHDGHAIVAATGLVAVGLFGSFRLPAKAGAALLCVAVLGWSLIVKDYRSVAPAVLIEDAAGEFATMVRRSIDRLHGDPRSTFEASLQTIRDLYPLTERSGTADIYPVDQEILIAHHIPWSPRPVMQSYSAYSPFLLKLNSGHLNDNAAPDHVYYQISLIDGRFPTLDDAASLIGLTTGYRLVAREAGYAVLDRAPSASQAPALSAVVAQSTVGFGQKIALPMGPSPIWAEIEVEPTLLGRLANLLFKLPELYLTTTFKDGHVVEYRYVSGIGSSGFLISPAIETTDQFIALLSPHRASLLADRTVASVSLAPRTVATTIGHWLWQPAITVRFKQFNPPVQADATRLVMDGWLPTVPDGYSATISTMGDCVIDSLHVNSANDASGTPNPSTLNLAGWSVVSTAQGFAPDAIFVVITDAEGGVHVAPAKQFARPDVNRHFDQAAMGPVGFSAVLEMPSHGKGAVLHLMNAYKGELHFCPASAALPDPP